MTLDKDDWQQRQQELRDQLPDHEPARQFAKGQRVWHGRRGWGTYLLQDSWDTDTSEVLFDAGDAGRITTALLSTADPDGAGPPPVPDVALAEFADVGLTPS